MLKAEPEPRLTLLGRVTARSLPREKLDPALSVLASTFGADSATLDSALRTHHAHIYNGTDSNTFYWGLELKGALGASNAWKFGARLLYCHADSSVTSSEVIVYTGSDAGGWNEWARRKWTLCGWPPGPNSYPEPDDSDAKPESLAGQWTFAAGTTKPEDAKMDSFSRDAVDALCALAARVQGGCCDAFFSEETGWEPVMPMNFEEVEKLVAASEPSAESLANAAADLRAQLAGPATVFAIYSSPVALKDSKATGFPEDLWTAGTQSSVQLLRSVSMGYSGLLRGSLDGAVDAQGTTVRLTVSFKPNGGDPKGIASLEKDVEQPDADAGFKLSLEDAGLADLGKAMGKQGEEVLKSMVENLGMPGLAVAEGGLWWKLPEAVV